MQLRLAFALLLPATIGVQACSQPADQPADQVATEAAASTTADINPDSVTIDLRPGDDHYELARLDVGALAISLDTIEASGGGSVIRLQIGNTSGAGLEDLSATLQWGPLAPDGTPQTAPERTREAPLAANVAAGKWTRATVTLADIPPGELGFLRLTNIGYTRLILK